MNREIPFDDKGYCAVCGHRGAYDVMGDYICPRCLSLEIKRNNGDEDE